MPSKNDVPEWVATWHLPTGSPTCSSPTSFKARLFRTSVRCSAPVSAGAGNRPGGVTIARGQRRGGAVPRHRGRHRPPPGRAGGKHSARRGERPLRLSRWHPRPRPPETEPRAAGTPELAARASLVDRGPRAGALLQYLMDSVKTFIPVAVQ